MTIHANSRLEAFCDGVFAIALTLLIIDVKIPSAADLHTSHDLWLALLRLAPSVFAFVSSFGIIFITWVNHHGALRLVDRSSRRFMYANGFLLLTVVFVPFPTALLGETLLTDHASPAVVLYSATFALQAVGWRLLSWTALAGGSLTTNASAVVKMRTIGRDAYFAFAVYSACAILAVWLPMTIAVVLTVMWLVWLVYGIRLKGA